MTEAEWNQCADPDRMLAFLSTASGRKLRLFGAACCRRIWHLLKDKRSQDAVIVAESFADNEASYAERLAAHQDADDAADDTHGGPALAAYDLMDADAGFAATVVSRRVAGVVDDVSGTNSAGHAENAAQVSLLRCIFGPRPFRPITFDPTWLTPTVKQLAESIYQERAFVRLSILADALEDAGCNQPDVLGHLRDGGEHCRGCWAVDVVTGRE
jgi:hypothetical protein